MWYHYARMSSLKYAAVVAAGAAIGAFIAIAVLMPQTVGAAASASKLILTQWLGLGTTTPSQRLSVAGSAYITGDVITGSGIKFPDGTTQTTAASGGGGGFTSCTTVSVSGSSPRTATCATGYTMTGGGGYCYYPPDNYSQSSNSNYPNGNGWTVSCPPYEYGWATYAYARCCQ